MRTLRFHLALAVCLLSFFLAACSGPEQSTEQEKQTAAPRAQESTRALPPNENVQQSSIGELQEVDLATRTLTIRSVNGGMESFFFTESTEISGAADAQGLSVQKESQVRIDYANLDGRKTAVRVLVIPR
jgi:hypothetical protein